MTIRADNPEVIRLVTGLAGSVPMHMALRIRFDYGQTVPWVKRNGIRLSATAGPEALSLVTPVTLEGRDRSTVASFSVSAGQEIPFVLSWHPSHHPAPRPPNAWAAVEDTDQWWREWSSRASVPARYRDLVVRSLVTLKALTYAPTGGIVAAATTSLPESLGGVRNWDYRYCWLRDATLTLYSLVSAGFVEEARDWREWLIRAVAGDPACLQIMYGPAGERRLAEYELDHLVGYENSRPVRIGNAASSQFQLDVYGEVMDALYLANDHGLTAAGPTWDLQKALMEYLESCWHEPDEGIWEVRGPRRHFTHSKVMAWVALDRAVKACERFGVEGPAPRWGKLRDEIHDQVCREGYNARVGAFTQYYGGDRLDASVLMIPLVGFLPADDPRMLSTIEAVRHRLMPDGLVLRYEQPDDLAPVDGLPPGEGAFLACSFWLADCMALAGDGAGAKELFERLCGLTNDVGLLAEEYDTVSHRQVGNFPQAFSHVSLVNSAMTLTGASRALRLP
jgi:GH15 family glucan-1,4-alpha-glucosidase